MVGDKLVTTVDDDNANVIASSTAGAPNRDQLRGQDGNDEMSGGEGDDLMFGQVGNDTLNGDGGNDRSSHEL